jgi:uncharacterized protein with PQ loop repeat
MIDTIALVASVVLPLFNVPLVVGIEKRKSSKDISLLWTFGVWVCLCLMLPAALTSQDLTFKVFGVINALAFTCVVVQVLRYH